jgi:hypothetical protein
MPVGEHHFRARADSPRGFGEESIDNRQDRHDQARLLVLDNPPEATSEKRANHTRRIDVRIRASIHR